MKIIILCLLLLSCGKDDQVIQCAPTKSLSSTWVLRGGATFDYSACSVDKTCYFYADSSCNDDADEFSVHFTSDGIVYLGQCNETIITDTGKWKIGCDNVLRLTNWKSNDPDDIFD